MSALLAVAAVNIDWLGLAGRERLRDRAGSPPAWRPPPSLYFGVLLAAGLRPRDFSRRA